MLPKPVLLTAAWLLFYVALIPPQVSSRQEGVKKYGKRDTLSKVIPWRKSSILVTAIYLINSLCETAVILAHSYPSSTPSSAILSTLINPADVPNNGAASIAPHTFWLTGFAFLILGSCISWASHRALGNLYTTQLAIRDQHRLVTGGPYALVRHPGYLGLSLTVFGMSMCMFGPGSWLQEGGWLDRPLGKYSRALVVSWSVYASVVLIQRVPLEDEMLKKEFGTEWTDWAKRVRYAVVPGVF